MEKRAQTVGKMRLFYCTMVIHNYPSAIKSRLPEYSTTLYYFCQSSLSALTPFIDIFLVFRRLYRNMRSGKFFLVLPVLQKADRVPAPKPKYISD